MRAHFMRSFLGTFALTIWFYAAISKLPLGTAMTLNYTSPLYMALIVIFLAVKNGESFSRAQAPQPSCWVPRRHARAQARTFSH